MGYTIKTIEGELKEYAFDFGGVVALRNFTARTNGNRLIIESAENANFTILDALVNEVEIDGIIYDNVFDAQKALQRLVFSPTVPKILTEKERETIANFKTIIQDAQVHGAKTYQTLAELEAVTPVPPAGTAAKVANDINEKNNGYYAVVDGGWVQDAELVAQEIDKNNTNFGVCGHAVSVWADKEIFPTFLGDKSLYGIPSVHKNHIFSYISDTEGGYQYSEDFDCAWVLLSEKSINLTVAGAVFTRLLFFSSATPSADTLLQSTKKYKNVKVPQGSVLALLTLRKADNSEGYDNLKVKHLGVAVSQGELTNSERSSLLRLDYKIERNSLLAINNGLIKYVVNDDFDSILVSVYRDSRYITVTGVVMHRISYFSNHEDLSISSFLSTSEEYVSKVPQGSVLALLTLRKTENSEGYDNLKVEQIGAPPSSLQVLQNTGNLFSISGRFTDRDGAEKVYEQVETTPFLPITGTEDITIKGANNASVPAVVFFDKNYKCIGSFSEMEKKENRTYKVTAKDIPEHTVYIRCNRNKVADRDDSYIRGVNIASILKMVSDLSYKVQNPPAYTYVVVGKNLLNPNEFLRGVTYATSTGLVASVDGILSNKLRLTPGKYSLQGVAPYRVNNSIVRILKFDDRDEFISAEGVVLDENGVGTYEVKSCTTGENSNGYVSYWRLVLQYDKNRLFNEKTAQFEKGDVATEFEPCTTELVENPYYNKSKMMAFLTGASSSIPGNGYFETACEKLGLKHRNVAVSGESVMQHADKAWRGTLYTPEELEEIDIFVTSHIHNYNVAFRGRKFEKVESFKGALNTDGNRVLFDNTDVDYWEVDTYNIASMDKVLVVSTIAINSSLPYVVFQDKDRNFISALNFDNLNSEPTPVIEREILIPDGTSYVLVKRHSCNGNSKTELRGKTAGILCKTVSEYESKGYDTGNNPLAVQLDKNNTKHRLLPFGGQGSQGALIPNDLYDERYSAGYDYLIKKYKKDCYELRLNPNSKWYGTKSGKPAVIVCVNQWHDGYVRYNESLKILAKRHGAIYCDVAGKMPFSYRENNPLDNAIRNTAMYCNNAIYGSGNDTEDIPINGVVYTNMGWHPTRKWDEPIQLMRANALAQSLREAVWRLRKGEQII